MNAETKTLYRPVGPNELKLIAASGYREFPPRLPEQPIFYPVLNEEYARQISTGDAELIEHTKNDSYWGDGGDGTGKNRLGQLLMELRAELRKSS